MTSRFNNRLKCGLKGIPKAATRNTKTCNLLIFQLNLLCGLADRSRCITKEYPWSLIDPQVHGQRTSIFGHKNSLPSDLWSQIFYIQFASIAQSKRMQRIRLLQRFTASLKSQRLSIRIQRFLYLMDLCFSICDCCTWRIGQKELARRLGIVRIEYFNLKRKHAKSMWTTPCLF